MNFQIFSILVLFLSTIKGEEVELAHLLTIYDGYFSESVLSTGLENEDDITANSYSIIGRVNPANFQDSDGYYRFRLVYDNGQYVDDSNVEWKQKSWLTDEAVVGFEAINVNQPDVWSWQYSTTAVFKGLRLSTHIGCYLGNTFETGADQCWNAVCPTKGKTKWTAWFGGFNAKESRGFHLYALQQSTETETEVDAISDELEIAHLLNSDDGFFDSSVISTGLQNENDITANTYSIIGSLNTAQYQNSEGYYTLRLVYNNVDGTTSNTEWKQTSWITAESITGFEAISVSQPDVTYSYRLFKGLGKSDQPTKSYLDGNGAGVGSTWWNSVCPLVAYQGGFPGFNAKVAKGFTLYILKVDVEIAHLLDSNNGFFSSSVISTGLENEGDITANTYSIIGSLNTAQYQDSEGYYTLRLVYQNVDGTASNVEWKQSSWITAESITGFEAISVSQPDVTYSGRIFKGLGKSDQPSKSYLDGNGAGIGSTWWNSVCPLVAYQEGFPGFNAKVAKGFTLYIKAA